MAASPDSVVPSPTSNARRRPLALTQRRIEANRRNAARSTGPRSAEGKARVARNAVRHGFFVAPEKWTPEQRRDFEETLDGLRDDLKPQGVLEDSCVTTMAQSYVRMASVVRYENIAALEYHQRQDRELNERIAAANAVEAARLEAQREELRRAGLWRPTIPGPRDARAIVRYAGSLDRSIRQATSQLKGLKSLRTGGRSTVAKAQKQTHYSPSPNSRPGDTEGPRMPSTPIHENAKTNPLTSMFTGNRHARRRAKALAARRK